MNHYQVRKKYDYEGISRIWVFHYLKNAEVFLKAALKEDSWEEFSYDKEFDEWRSGSLAYEILEVQFEDEL